MTDPNWAILISNVCCDAGKNKGIEILPDAPWGAQTARSWGVGYEHKRLGSAVTLTYWFSTDRLLRERVFLIKVVPHTPEQQARFTRDISAKLDTMMEWLEVA
jgi:hypothetical protein